MPTPEHLEKERQKNYGDPLQCHVNIAHAWTSYRRQVRASVEDSQGRRATILFTSVDVANMMALMKIIRAGYNPYHRDNYDDAITYLTFARRFACGEDKRSDSSVSKPSPIDDKNSDATGDSQGVRYKQDESGILRSGLDTGKLPYSPGV